MVKDFNITTNMVGEVLVMKTEGYINNNGGETISEEFSKHYANGVNKVLLDIEGSKVVNSIGISFLIEIIEKLNEKGGKLYFSNMDAAIEKTFAAINGSCP